MNGKCDRLFDILMTLHLLMLRVSMTVETKRVDGSSHILHL